MTAKNVILGIVVLIALVVGAYFLISVSYSNNEIRQRNLVNAQQETCKAFFDRMWKILQQKAQVPEQYKDAFRDIYPSLMAGRYAGERGGALMSWITESNPQFDVSLYRDLSTAIEAERASYFHEQKKLISVNNEHKNILQTFPGSWFLAGREIIEIVIITSEQTQAAYSTGQENNIDLFAK